MELQSEVECKHEKKHIYKGIYICWKCGLIWDTDLEDENFESLKKVIEFFLDEGEIK